MPVSAEVALQRQQRHDNKLRRAADIIPPGPYCYGAEGRCQYWKLRKDKPDQGNGYCRLLKAGDWMRHPRGTSLLWDQCKECGINRDEQSDER